MVFGPISITSFPLRDAIEVFVPHPQKNGGRYIPVRITVLIEFPATADLRAAKVETRTVDPPVPPVVLYVDCDMTKGVGNRWIVHTIQGQHSQQRDRRL